MVKTATFRFPFGDLINEVVVRMDSTVFIICGLFIRFGTFFHGKCSTPFDGQGKVLAHAFYPKSGKNGGSMTEWF